MLQKKSDGLQVNKVALQVTQPCGHIEVDDNKEQGETVRISARPEQVLLGDRPHPLMVLMEGALSPRDAVW